MIRRFSLLFVAATLCLGTIWAVHTPATGADEKEVKKKEGASKIALRMFMRKKLESSQSVLEGLALEDFDLIAKGAKELKTTSAAAEFMVIHDPLYTEYADDFRRVVDKMAKAAKEKRIDGATLAYMDMTMSCVECHKYVRNVLIAK
ncbi:MAG: hypothetical protein ACM3U2_08085 [Deltaproteobacteria bacterium]